MIPKPIFISTFFHLLFITLIITGLPSLKKFDDIQMNVVDIEIITNINQSEEKNKDIEIEEPVIEDLKKYSSTPNIKPANRSDNTKNLDVTDYEEELPEVSLDKEDVKKLDQQDESYVYPTEKPILSKINDKLLTNLGYDESKEETKKVTALLDKFPDEREVGDNKKEIKEEQIPKKNITLTGGEILNMKRQVEMCWNPPRGVRGAGDQIVKVQMILKPDGSLVSVLPITRVGGEVKGIAIEAALRAVSQCQPYNLPIEKYDIWKEVTFTFDPRNMLGG